VRFVQRCRVKDGIDAAYAISYEIAVGNRADPVSEWRLFDVEANRLVAFSASEPRQDTPRFQ
jgi:hypothetical protein